MPPFSRRELSCPSASLVALMGLLGAFYGFVTPNSKASETLQWSDLPELPNAVGLGGPVVGTHGEALIVGGGANFPDAPPWSTPERPAGAKVWHRAIYGLKPDAQSWTDAGELPYPLAYAATVSTDAGVYVFGGQTYGALDSGSEGPSDQAEVLLMSWNEDTETVSIQRNALPPLPRPSSYHRAERIGQTLFVAASHASSLSSRRLDSKAFWSLDLDAPVDQRQWVSLPTWPGPARIKMATATQNAGADPRYATPVSLYLFSGSTWAKNADGVEDLTQFEFFDDGYRYEPKSQTWTPVAPLPRAAETRVIDNTGYRWSESGRHWIPSDSAPDENRAIDWSGKPRPTEAATAIGIGASHILLFSGNTGRYTSRAVQDRPEFSPAVYAYHTITDTWRPVGDMPQAVVTTESVAWNDSIVIPSGETQPGIRTPRVQSLTLDRNAQGLSMANGVVIVLYLGALVWLGLRLSKTSDGLEGFFLGGRRIPWWAAGISIYATQLSAITFVALPSTPYATNWVLYPGQWMIFAMAPLVAFIFLPFFRRLSGATAYEYLERRFNRAVRLFGGASFVVFQLGRMAIVVYLPALALTSIVDISMPVAIALMGVLATLYTAIGGIRAVIWTDVIQSLVLWLGLAFSIAVILGDQGGIAPVLDQARADGKLQWMLSGWNPLEMATLWILLGNLALQFGPYVTDQAVVQRYMTTANEGGARRAILLNGALTIPFALVFFLLGTALYVHFKSHPELLGVTMDNDQAFPFFIAQSLPTGVSGLVVAGIFAASMSTLDSGMHSVATTVSGDFLGLGTSQDPSHSALKTARWVTVIVGTFATLLALALSQFNIQSLLFLFQKLLGFLSPGLVGAFLLGIFTSRANATGVFVGAIASFLLVAYLAFQTSVNFYLYAILGIPTAVLVGYGTSRLCPIEGCPAEGTVWRGFQKIRES